MKLKKRFTLSLKNNLRFIPDEAYMRMYFKAKLHYEPDFENPKTVIWGSAGTRPVALLVQSASTEHIYG